MARPEPTPPAVAAESDRRLVGRVIAARLLSPGGDRNYDEMRAWRRFYPDLPEAGAMRRILQPQPAALLVKPQAAAVARAPMVAQDPDRTASPEPRTEAAIRAAARFSMADDKGALAEAQNAIGALGDRASTAHWIAGLAAWRLGRLEEAGRHFSALVGAKTASGWMQAAGAYWAGRVSERRGVAAAAAKWFASASQYPTTFYGMLATRKLGLDVARQIPAAFLAAAGVDRLPDGAHSRFPIPAWQPRSGFHVDPALVYAVARQESGFDPQAQNASGAAGLMQIMPGTARAVAPDQHALFDPSTNLEIGQRYLRRLMRDPNIGENLLLLAIAYNRGAGNLEQFRRMLRAGDPLLAVECIEAAQTRNFIQRVLANYWIYKTRMGGDTTSLTDLANGRLPLYRWRAGESAAAVFYTAMSN